MRYKFLIIVFLFCAAARAQPLPNHTWVNQQYRWVGGIFNNELVAPGVSGFPVFKANVFTAIDGHIMIDTANNRYYFYSGSAWRRLADSAFVMSNAQNFANTNLTLTGLRQHDFDNNTMDWLNVSSFQIYSDLSSTTRLLISSTNSDLYSPNQSSSLGVNNARIAINGADSVKILTDKFIIDSLPQAPDTTSWKPMVWNRTTNEVREFPYFPGGSGGSVEAALPIIGEQRSAVLQDIHNYSAFPTITWTPTKDTIYTAYMSKSNHVIDDPIVLAKSWDGGSSWSKPDSVTVDGVLTDAGTVSMIFTDNKLLIGYTSGIITYDTLRFAQSTSRTSAFYNQVKVPVPARFGQMVPYGEPKKAVSGTVYFPCYAWNTDSSWLLFAKTTDAGNTYTLTDPIITSNGNTSLWPNGWLTEFNVEVVQEGATDNTTQLMAVVRNDSSARYGELRQYYSTTGFEGTWTGVGLAADFAAPAYTQPGALIKNGDYMYLLVGARLIGEKALYVRRGKLPYVMTDTTQWGPWTKHYQMSLKGASNDGGYFQPFINALGQMRTIGYDVSPKHREGIDVAAKRMRIVQVPFTANNNFEGWGITNQSISTATLTTVTTPYIYFDTDSAYNADSVQVSFPIDGTYAITARVSFDTSSSGTYRMAILQMIDRGGELGGSNDTLYRWTIDEQWIQPSNNHNFQTINLSGIVTAQKGYRLRLSVMHDASGSLNLLNTNRLRRVRITAKKID